MKGAQPARSRSRLLVAPAVAALAALALTLSACGSSTPAASTTSTTAQASTTTTGAPVTGTLNVFAAASLTGAFNSGRTTLIGANPGLSLNYNFAGSNTLVAQIQQGAPADVFASADMPNMQKLVAAGLAEAPVTFARNKLEIAVAPGNPKHITGLADLAQPGVTVVLEAVGVPAGDYTRYVLASQHIVIAPKSLETDVKSALAKVSSGEADATVVYVTDVTAAGSAVSGVMIPDSLQPAITYPIAVVKATKNHAAAQAFVNSAVSGDVQKALEAAGFLPPQ
ncbi:MAG TPA: molybdate ABC transporter substrate-binding protein [Acidimicrobiales bacterium]|nr:molybdate ABC transporter substrate-binding protein [Acidimicrobiales bacterium]